MTAADPDDVEAVIRERLARTAADAAARRAHRDQARAVFAARRAAGLTQRHAHKLNRQQRSTMPDPRPCGCTTDQMCPQHIDALPQRERLAAHRAKRCADGHHTRTCPKTCPEKTTRGSR